MNYNSSCEQCSCQYPIVPADGPVTSRLLFVGERPGRNENQSGRPFIGQAGQEFNEHLLGLAGLERDRIRITNTVKCFAEGNRKPDQKEVDSCGGLYLRAEIEEQEPELIVLMGGTACSVANGQLDVERDHGIKRRVRLYGEWRDVFVTYHPALGLHDPRKLRELRDDFIALGKYLDGDEVAKVDPFVGKEKYVVGGQVRWTGDDGIGLDSETVKGKLWSIQLSDKPGTGHIYRADDDEAMRYVQATLSRLKGRVYIHNEIHDCEELEKFGLKLEWGKVVDTMALAYHRGLPQGLKVLAWRLCGMEMKSYEDVVMGRSKEAVLNWAVEGMGKVPEKIAKKKNPFVTELTRIARSIDRGGDDGTYDPWKRWQKVKGIYGKVLGFDGRVLEFEMPEAGLDLVPWEEAVRYGCRDADAGLRVGLELCGANKPDR